MIFYPTWLHSHGNSYTYSTPRRSLCVRPDAGRVWTIFPPTHWTHWTHEYLASRPANARTDTRWADGHAEARTGTQKHGRARRSTDGHAEARTDTQTGGRTRRSTDSDADALMQTQKHRRRRTDAEAKIYIHIKARQYN